MYDKHTLNPHPGKLVAIEGIDRAGKSTSVRKLVGLLQGCKMPIVTCGELRSPLADIIRNGLQKGISAFLKTYLFAADRAWTYEAECIPALKYGSLVLWDRYVDSAVVYRTVELNQSTSEIDIDFVRGINSPFIKPDLTIYIDVGVMTSGERAKLAGTREPYNNEFLEKARLEYQNLSRATEYALVNGEQSPENVAEDICKIIKQRFKELFE